MKLIKESIEGTIYIDLILSPFDIEKILDHFAVEHEIKVGDTMCSIAVRTQLETQEDEIDQLIEMEAKYYATNKEQENEEHFL